MRRKKKNNRTRSDTSSRPKKRAAIKKRAKKVAMAKTRANGTMTEAEFWASIRSALRRRSMFWRPISETRNKARRKYNGPNKRQKFEYQCSICENWFSGKNIAVDHIETVGILRKANDLPGFVERLFCDSSGLRVVCKNCHKEKTKEDKKKMRENYD